MVRPLSCALALIAALVAASPGSAQTALGTVRGAVLDQQGAVLPGVAVTLRQVDTNTSQTVVSTPEGRYVMPNLRPGKYEVTAQRLLDEITDRGGVSRVLVCGSSPLTLALCADLEQRRREHAFCARADRRLPTVLHNTAAPRLRDRHL